MSTDTGGKPAASLFAKLISRQRRPQITVGISLLLILAPIGVAYLDGVLDDFFSLLFRYPPRWCSTRAARP